VLQLDCDSFVHGPLAFQQRNIYNLFELVLDKVLELEPDMMVLELELDMKVLQVGMVLELELGLELDMKVLQVGMVLELELGLELVLGLDMKVLQVDMVLELELVLVLVLDMKVLQVGMVLVLEPGMLVLQVGMKVLQVDMMVLELKLGIDIQELELVQVRVLVQVLGMVWGLEGQVVYIGSVSEIVYLVVMLGQNRIDKGFLKPTQLANIILQFL
jgi:hypothetical protein